MKAEIDSKMRVKKRAHIDWLGAAVCKDFTSTKSDGWFGEINRMDEQGSFNGIYFRGIKHLTLQMHGDFVGFPL